MINMVQKFPENFLLDIFDTNNHLVRGLLGCPILVEHLIEHIATISQETLVCVYLHGGGRGREHIEDHISWKSRAR